MGNVKNNILLHYIETSVLKTAMFSTSGSLMGFITAVPAEIRIHDDEIKMVEINFLCVHKKLR